MKIIVYQTQQQAALALSSLVSQQLEAAISNRGQASLAVAGGSTPVLFFHELSQAELNWSKVNLTTTDERQVPMDHPRSNARLVKEKLLNHQARAAHFYTQDSSVSLPLLSTQFEDHFTPLDVCVLGMGNDGHTASLFPGVNERLMTPDGPLLMAMVDAPGDLEPRITLTTRALLTAQDIHILIHGEDKKTVLDQAMSGEDVSLMPVRSILQYANERVVVHYAKD